ncbi:MAG: hypothetical protein OXT09_34680, partial [Myxococcales bacterium]|nr:hypothetical protein [Myxococcales bacterium]
PNPWEDVEGDGVINWRDVDSDDDGLFDGTELGFDCDDDGTDTSKDVCIADADEGATTTSPLDADTDDGGVSDGDEDTDKDGEVDSGEGDPNDPSDDGMPPPGEECAEDADCGDASSGQVCVDESCQPGCRGEGGNGCPTGQLCSSSTMEVGSCGPADEPDSPMDDEAPIVTPDEAGVFLGGGGCECRAGGGGGLDGSSAALLAGVLLLIGRRRRRG